MSTSTVPVTSNPAIHSNNNNNTSVLALGARRRTVAVSEKKVSNIEMVSDAAAGVSDQVSSEKSKDHSSLQIKKALINSTTVSPRPRRKPDSTKARENPRWKTVMSVFTKNFLLLIIVLGLVQLMSKLTKSGYKDMVLPPNRVNDMESRIGEIDSLVKKTAKMLQVQYEVVDKKIENEVGRVRSDLVKKIEEKGEIFEKGLKKLEDRADGLHKALSEFETYKYLTKEDLQQFSDELKNSRGGEGSDEAPSLDEIKGIARDIVLKEIERHEADGLGRADYALASSGAVIIGHSEPWFPVSGQWLKIPRVVEAPQKMLQPSFGEPGQCFPLKGSNGFVEIKLRTEIIPEAVTLEHVAKSVAYDRTSAPKDCQLSGWFKPRDADQSKLTTKKFVLAEFTYDLERSNVQTFNVDSTNGGIINTVRLDFSSNHGAPHTCIYRLRIHGHEPEADAVLQLQA